MLLVTMPSRCMHRRIVVRMRYQLTDGHNLLKMCFGARKNHPHSACALDLTWKSKQVQMGGQGRSTPSSSSPSPTYVSTELSSNRYWRNGQKPEYSERLSQRLEFFCGSLRRTAEQWTRMRNLVNWRSWFSKTERCCRLTCCNAMRSEREGEEKRRKERERERESSVTNVV